MKHKLMKSKFYTIYNWVINALSLYFLLLFIIETIIVVPVNLQKLIVEVDFIICLIFLTDWFVFFIKARDKKYYLVHRFLDLISSIPCIQSIRWLRLFRILRVLRALRGISLIFNKLRKTPMKSAILLYGGLTLTVFSYCSLAMYRFEIGPNHNVHNFSDALWLCFTTLSTVGYGDIYPVTIEGKLISILLVVVGAGFWALLSGEFAAALLQASRNAQINENHTQETVD